MGLLGWRRKRIGKRLSDDDFVVAQADGSPLRPHSLGQEWVRFLATTTLPRIRFHDLRHSETGQHRAVGILTTTPLGGAPSCARSLRGVLKRLGSPYRSGRADCWVKVKNPAAPAEPAVKA
jgi:hypothetical protein